MDGVKKTNESVGEDNHALLLFNKTRYELIAENKKYNATMISLNSSIQNVSYDNDNAEQLKSVDAQVQDNTRILHKIAPRMEAIQKRMRNIEALLQYGNMSEVVEDGAKQKMTEVLKDMGR